MLAKVKSFGLSGLNGYEVEVETDVHKGLPGIEMVGLPDAAIKESKERVRSAIKNSALQFSPNKITINLAPADVKKEGPMYDLPIALAILAATEQLNVQSLANTVFVGELSLDGSLRRVRGILPLLLAAKDAGYTQSVIPYENRAEAACIEGIKVFPCRTLGDAVAHFRGEKQLEPLAFTPFE
ncbi:MAG: magnesium chelatase, partial [Clostridiales bacterium]|nr:magnesium chelatase [Clostridiales bacterium]